jgi:hypothetical protein
VFIRHLTTINASRLNDAISIVLEFIWMNLNCSNVRVEIFHLKDPESGHIKVDMEIKNAFSNSGFKWKTLTNDRITGKRA